MKQFDTIIETLRRGAVGVLPTDTLYGIVGSALRPATVRRIYRLRRRNPKKPMIILIGAVEDLEQFGVAISKKNKSGSTKNKFTMNIKKLLNEVWPGKVSVILPIGEGMPPAQRKQLLTKFSYLHRGTGTLAFRLPRPASLRSLLAATGPLVAPSANLEGEPPAKTIREAKQYFGDGVEFYLDAGRKEGKASKIFKMEGGTIQRIR